MSTPDTQLLRRAWRYHVAQTAAVILAVLLLMGVVAFVLVVRDQSRDQDRALQRVVSQARDIRDPPLGAALARRSPDGRSAVTQDAPAGIRTRLKTALAGPAGSTDAELNAGTYRILVVDRSDGTRWAVAADLTGLDEQRVRLVEALLLAESAGLAGAVLAAALLSRRAVRPLARALEMQRAFVADASHELRAPLTVLHTRAQLIERDARRRGDGAMARQLEGLVHDTRALGDVVEDLLTAAELEHRPERTEQVDLEAVARGVVDSMAAHAEKSGVDIAVARDPSVATGGMVIAGNGTALRRATMALVDNALGHVERGGHVTVELARSSHEVHVRVCDDGVGIDPQEAHRLFARFSHGDQGNGRRFGLGLALVQHVAQAHGGSVLVGGSPGDGANFTLVLPLRPSNGDRRANALR